MLAIFEYSAGRGNINTSKSSGEWNKKTIRPKLCSKQTPKRRESVLQEERPWKEFDGPGALTNMPKKSLGYYPNTKSGKLLRQICKESIIKETDNPKEDLNRNHYILLSPTRPKR